MMVSPLVALCALLPLLGAALPSDYSGSVLSLLERGDELGLDDEYDFDLSYEDVHMLQEGVKKPHKRASLDRKKSYAELTKSIDEIIPILEMDFKSRTQELKVALATFKERQRDMDVAKRDATQAMKALRLEADKRRRAAAERKKAKEKERLARDEMARTAKEAMIKKAQALMGSTGAGSADNFMLSETALSTMVNVLMALPGAVENPIFVKRLNRGKEQAVTAVQDFLNITRRKTSKFVLAASKASDVELGFLLARYFHEASFRVKAMQSDGMKIARDLNIVMPRELRQAFLPVVKGVRAQALPLRVNATSLASATITDACLQMSSLMSNISDYNNKLNTMHSSMHDVWQISELILPKVGKIYPMKPIVIDTVKDFMSMATTQLAGLQEAADEIVVNIGPIVAERLQCTWSAAFSRSSMGWAALLAVLAGYLFV
ncbi:unnamed protein product [Prorocentrum cordatum]|uniref:Uncharacterized protein n=1 Tax=Prorocentrum cordatum TaxID=2364126 RepID=A0ABN9Q3S6_9DINO|nr:unnamed protein product [Polarella glacialis]